MLLQMPIEVRLLPETAVAMTTPERSLFIMNVSDVSLQIRRYREGPLAVLAAIGLFACVRPQMSG